MQGTTLCITPLQAWAKHLTRSNPPDALPVFSLTSESTHTTNAESTAHKIPAKRSMIIMHKIAQARVRSHLGSFIHWQLCKCSGSRMICTVIALHCNQLLSGYSPKSGQPAYTVLAGTRWNAVFSTHKRPLKKQ